VKKTTEENGTTQIRKQRKGRRERRPRKMRKTLSNTKENRRNEASTRGSGEQIAQVDQKAADAKLAKETGNKNNRKGLREQTAIRRILEGPETAVERKRHVRDKEAITPKKAAGILQGEQGEHTANT